MKRIPLFSTNGYPHFGGAVRGARGGGPGPPLYPGRSAGGSCLRRGLSSHPIARSVVEAYGQAVAQQHIEAVEELTGLGIKAVWDGKEILAGSNRLLEQAGIEITPTAGHSSVYVAINGVYAGTITLSDSPKKKLGTSCRGPQKMGKKSCHAHG